MVRAEVRFRPEICKLRIRDFEIAQRILQIAQIDKLRSTVHRQSYTRLPIVAASGICIWGLGAKRR